jgi:hypothetical protein
MPPEFIQPPKSTSIESPHESTLAVYMANRHQYIPHPQEEDDAIAHHGWRRHLASLMVAVAVVIPWGSAATPLPEAPAMSQSWLRVFRSPDAAHLGHGGGQARQTRAVQSEKCVARGGSEYDEMCMITACFTRVLQKCTGCLCMHFL